MKKGFLFFALIFLIGLGCNVFYTQNGPQPSIQSFETINPLAAEKHLAFLASDSLLGRDTPSPGLERAAEYIAGRFAEYGVQPVNGSYFHHFNLSQVSLGDSNTLELFDASAKAITFLIKRDYMPYGMTANGKAQAPVVFAGYGISAPEYDYDDYAGLDVKGKVVFVLKRGPQQENPASPFYLKKDSHYLQAKYKIENAIEHGAAAVLMTSDPLHSISLKPRGFAWPSLYKFIPDDALPFTLAMEEDEKIPAVQVGKKIIQNLFGSVDELKQIQKGIDSTMTPNSYPLDSKVMLQTSTSRQLYPTRNVVGLLKGSDPALQEEVVVVGAHYDHVGYIKNAPAEQDSIYNGADDNASGTTGVLLAAHAFAQNEVKPRRSILFIAFAGEEKGLYGSKAYTETPLFPLEKTVAMFNMDMIGRNHPDSLTLIGYKRSPELSKIVKKQNKKVGLTLAYDREFYFGNSDHASFARKDIPVIFFCTKETPDLHKVSDHVDKIDFHKLCRVVRLLYLSAWHTANLEKKPVLPNNEYFFNR